MYLEQVDRAIYEYLRRKVVSLGFLPDITQYASEEEYQAAKSTMAASLANNGKTLIDVYGTGSWESRGEKTDSKIVVERRDISAGKTGFSGVSEYVPVMNAQNQLASYDRVKMPDKTSNIEYEVRYITTTVKMERILLDIIDAVFGKGTKMLFGVNEEGNFTEETFPLMYNGSVDVRHKEFVEGFSRFVAQEVFLGYKYADPAVNVPLLIKIDPKLHSVDKPELDNIRNGN